MFHSLRLSLLSVCLLAAALFACNAGAADTDTDTDAGAAPAEQRRLRNLREMNRPRTHRDSFARSLSRARSRMKN